MTRHRLSACLIVAITCITAGIHAHAGPQLTLEDYAADNTSWRGLSMLRSLAEGLQYTVVPQTTLDWSETKSSDIVIVLSPTQQLEPTAVTAFVTRGGQLLLADDFGSSGAVFKRLGVTREDAVGVAARGHENGLWYAPLAGPVRHEHPLAQNIDEVVTNHPAVFSSVRSGHIVFGFASDEGVVIAGTRGAGSYVLVSDPSIFINRMMRYAGNLKLAENTLRFLSPTPTRIILVAGNFASFGMPPRTGTEDTDKVADLLEDFNLWLEDKNDYLPRVDLGRVAGVVAALLIFVLSIAALPLTRRIILDGAWAKAGGQREGLHGVEEILSHYSRGPKSANYALPATMLRDTLNVKLSAALHQGDALYALPLTELSNRLASQIDRDAGTALRRVAPLIKHLPSRSQVQAPWSNTFVTKREFARIVADCELIRTALENASSQVDSDEHRLL